MLHIRSEVKLDTFVNSALYIERGEVKLVGVHTCTSQAT